MPDRYSTFRSRRRPIRGVSAKREEEDRALAVARVEVRLRDGDACYAATRVPTVRCQGPLELHHLAPRSVARKLYADKENLRFLCLAHHDWVDAEPALAHEVGLHRFSWEDSGPAEPDQPVTNP